MEVKVRVAYTVEVDDDYRMALGHSWGECGTLATRGEIQTAACLMGSNNDDDLMQEWADCPICQEAARP